MGGKLEAEKDGDQDHRADDRQRPLHRHVEPRSREHFPANEYQHQRQSIFEKMEALRHISEQEVKCPQPHDGEDVGREDNEGVGSHREDGRDTVDGEHEIACFDHHQYQEHRRRPTHAINPHKELLAVEIGCHTHVAPQPAQQRILLQIGLLFGKNEHLDASHDQEGPKNI
ncbi:hypothetical protein D3C86_1697460 [compost metagenome]